MLPANSYAIRLAQDDDAAALARLAALDSQRPLSGRVLIGHLDGRPAAALSLDDGRVAADPFRPTAHLVAHLRLRAGVLRAVERTPSLRERLLAALAPEVRRPARASD